MANVLFKRGEEARLLALGTYVDGCFYLTTDTNRLFVGKGTALVPVNEGVITVAEVSNLPTDAPIAGSFYYVTNGNILCVYNGKDWVQINSNTDNAYKVTKVELTKTRDAEAKKILLVSKITMKKYNNLTNEEIANSEFTVNSETIEITQDDFNALVDGASVGLVSALADKTLTLNTTGIGADETKAITLLAGDNVTFVKNEDNSITISSTDTNDNTTYKIETKANGTDKAEVVYTEVNGTGAAQKVTYVATDKLNVQVIDGAISYGHDTLTVNRPTAVPGTLSADRTFTVVTDVKDDGYGHITELNTSTFTLPTDANTFVSGATYDEAVGAEKGKLIITRNDGKKFEIDLGLSAEQIGKNIDQKVDSAIKGLSALNYKGTVGTGGTVAALPATPAAGDMYMAAANSVEGEVVSYAVGDLIIAVGTENAEGVIENPSWTVVPSGNDLHTDTQFSIQAGKSDTGVAKIELYNETTKEVDTLVNFTDDDVVIVEQKSATEINFSHAKGKADTDIQKTGDAIEGAHAGTFHVITSVKADEYGHLAEVKTSEVTLPKDNDTKSAIKAGVEDGVGSIVLTETNSVTNESTEDTVKVVAGIDINIKSGNTNEIKVAHAAHNGTKETGTATPAHKGTFDAITEVTLSNGHVDSYKVTTITLPEDKDTTYDLGGTATVADNVATIKTTLTAAGSAEADVVDYKLASETLTLTASENVVNVEMVWGSF